MYPHIYCVCSHSSCIMHFTLQHLDVFIMSSLACSLTQIFLYHNTHTSIYPFYSLYCFTDMKSSYCVGMWSVKNIQSFQSLSTASMILKKMMTTWSCLDHSPPKKCFPTPTWIWADYNDSYSGATYTRIDIGACSLTLWITIAIGVCSNLHCASRLQSCMNTLVVSLLWLCLLLLSHHLKLCVD